MNNKTTIIKERRGRKYIITNCAHCGKEPITYKGIFGQYFTEEQVKEVIISSRYLNYICDDCSTINR